MLASLCHATAAAAVGLLVAVSPDTKHTELNDQFKDRP
jgi:hypothetical protein